MAKLLIIEDSETQRAEARRVATDSEAFEEILEAEDGLRGLKRMLQDEPDVVLCDLEMPGMNGEKLLRARASRPELANVPFLFITGTQDIDRRSQLLADGACDVIAKPFHPADLAARLRLHLRVKLLQDELLAKNTALARMSSTDSLTGLATRRVAEELLAMEIKRVRRHDLPLALMMADLDHFKSFNDTHGHLAGDAVLRGVSGLLRAAVRASDVAARFGGEEIIVVLPHTDAAGALVVAERWRQRVEQETFRIDGGEAMKVTVSVGIAGFDPSIETPEQLIAAADAALYAAKHAGRNCVELHRPDDGATDPGAQASA